MNTMKLGGWKLGFDDAATQKLYSLLPKGAAKACRCPGCENYLRAREGHFPESLADLLRKLGADPGKEISVRRVAPLDEGHSLYAGSFAVMGRILEGEADDNREGWRVDVFEELSKETYVALRLWHHPPHPFADAPCVRLRFLFTLPWIGHDPSPPLDLTGCRGPGDLMKAAPL